MNAGDDVAHHYSCPDLLMQIEKGLGLGGKRREDLEIDDLLLVDEFHVRGAAATAELIQLLGVGMGLDAGKQVLDLGSGLGGPARRLAKASGCHVTGIDLSADYCAAGNALSQWTGLTPQVELVTGDASDLSRFPDDEFDAAWTLHTAMNILRKDLFYREVERVLKPGAKFLMYDILATGQQELQFPVPWAQEASASFLHTPAEQRAALERAGFRKVEFHDRTTECLRFLEKASLPQRGSELPSLGLHLLFGPKFREMIVNLAGNFAQGRVTAAITTCYKHA